MDCELWHMVTRTVVRVNRQLPRMGRRPRYGDVLIVRMMLWTVWHDRPLSWGCDCRHYGPLFRPRQLPSISQFCRRLRTTRVRQMVEQIHDQLSHSDSPAAVSFFDGKPMVVGRGSRDRDAKKGYADGSFRRGYRLHAWATEDGRIPRFALTSMNVGEPSTARELTDRIEAGTLVLADANYDSAPLYRAVDARGAQLLTPLKGRSHAPQQQSRMGPARRRAIQWWEKCPAHCRTLLAQRDQIERIFAALTNFGGGLSPLPSWVRRERRVWRWVAAKLIIYHARLRLRQVA